MNFSFNAYGIDNQSIVDYANETTDALTKLQDGTGEGNGFLGWLKYESTFNDSIIQDVKSVAEEIRENADVLIVLGIGGSYLGARAVIEALGSTFEHDGVEVVFAGFHLSGEYLVEVMRHVENKRVYVNVISKSGTTLETALAFRTIKRMMREKYPDDYTDRMIATTDVSRGALRSYADFEGMRTFMIPNDIGGRFSVFTPVGLLPIAVSGIDLDDVLLGLRKGIQDFNITAFEDNPAQNYAAARYALYHEGKQIELFAFHNPKLACLGEWLKQLFGESEGKDGKGLFPASAMFSTDLHSLGQWIQDGSRNLFETMVVVKQPEYDLPIAPDSDNWDGLNKLSGKSYDEIDKIMMSSAMKAHLAGGVPCMNIEIGRLDAFGLAYLMYFFMVSCAISGYLLGVNPFNQPGVETYKNNMKSMME